MKKTIHTILTLSAAILLFSACSKEAEEAGDTIQDVDQTAALKKVELKYDSMSYQLALPEGAKEAIANGKTFEELKMQDSAKYCNPAFYGVTLAANMRADNTQSGSSDAKFDGMSINTVMDTLKASPISTNASGFTVSKGTSKPVVAQGTLNLLTHRLVGLYMFKQIVAGTDMATTLSPKLNYSIGSNSGSFPFPDVKTDIPTRADANTKAFLQGLLDSKIFDK